MAASGKANLQQQKRAKNKLFSPKLAYVWPMFILVKYSTPPDILVLSIEDVLTVVNTTTSTTGATLTSSQSD